MSPEQLQQQQQSLLTADVTKHLTRLFYGIEGDERPALLNILGGQSQGQSQGQGQGKEREDGRGSARHGSLPSRGRGREQWFG